MAGGSLLPLPVQVCSYRSILYFCGALNYFLALVKLGFVPIAGVSVIVNGFVDAKGSVGTTMSGLQLFYVRRSRTTSPASVGLASTLSSSCCTAARLSIQWWRTVGPGTREDIVQRRGGVALGPVVAYIAVVLQ